MVCYRNFRSSQRRCPVKKVLSKFHTCVTQLRNFSQIFAAVAQASCKVVSYQFYISVFLIFYNSLFISRTSDFDIRSADLFSGWRCDFICLLDGRGPFHCFFLDDCFHILIRSLTKSKLIKYASIYHSI